MSQLRAMRREFRAAFAVVTACALMFSLLLSGAARPAHAFAAPIAFACDHVAHAQAASAATAQALDVVALKMSETRRDGGPGRSGHNCPDCCLAAHASHAVLPERLGWVTQPRAEGPARIRHSAIATQPPETFVSNGANGARAPPSR